jgi:hypothetical protein
MNSSDGSFFKPFRAVLSFNRRLISINICAIDCLALRLDESAHASLAASCEELRARTGNPP